MISHKHKCIFVHIPKTGGTSIEDLIWPRKRDRTEDNLWMGFIDRFHNKYQTGGLQHLCWMQIRQEVGAAVFENYYKFAIVRNPWDKAVSQYAYMKHREDLRDFVGMKEGDCFKTYLSLIQKTEHVQWAPQYPFIYDTGGEQMVDFVGRFEKFNDEVRVILKELGIWKWKIPHTNKSARKHYSEYYDDESKEIVGEMYQKDVELLGYLF